MIRTEDGLLQQKDTVLRWFRQKMLTESDAESQLKDIREQLADRC